MRSLLLCLLGAALSACVDSIKEPENYTIIGEPSIYMEGKAIRFYVVDNGGRESRLERAALVRGLAQSVILNSAHNEATVFLIPEATDKGTGNLLARAHCQYSKCEVEAGDTVDTIAPFIFPE